MPYTPTNWVANGAPSISATNLNKIEAGIQTAQATADSALGASGGLAGIIPVDSFSGADDTAKMNAALSYAAAQTNIPWLQLPYRQFNTGSSTFAVFTGMKIMGSGLDFGSKNLEISSGVGVTGNWRTTCGTGASALFQATSTVYDWAVSGVAFWGSSGSQIFRSTVNAYAVDFRNLTFYGCKHAFGTPTEKFLTTQAIFDGHWTHAGFTDTQFTIGGSDCQFNWFLNLDGPAGGAGKPLIIFDGLSKTDVNGYLYITAENDWTGLQIKGSAANRINIYGGTFEGRNATTLATRPVIDVQGGTTFFHGPQIDYVSDGSSSTVNGCINQSGGTIILDSPIYIRGTGVAATFPLLYQTAGTAVVRSPICGTSGEQIRIRWSTGTTDTAPAIANVIE